MLSFYVIWKPLSDGDKPRSAKCMDIGNGHKTLQKKKFMVRGQMGETGISY